MTIFFASDHAGFVLKNALLAFVRDELGHKVEDCGAHTHDEQDDYPDFVRIAAKKVAADSESRAIVLGGSGQGEAIVANRVPGIRAAVYYGEPPHPQTDADGRTLDMVTSTREHNDANILSIGARFVGETDAKDAVRRWLATPFPGDERHIRRIRKIDGSL